VERARQAAGGRLAVVDRKGASMPSHTVELVNRFVAEFNEGDLDAVDRYLAPRFFAYVPQPDEPTATERFRDLLGDLKAALPDMIVEVSELTTAGETTQGRLRLTGTHLGPLWGAPPSGNRVEWETPVSLRAMGDGFAVNFEQVALPEMIGLLRTLGLVNPPDEMDQPPRHPVSIPDFLAKVVFTGQAGDKECPHLDNIAVTEPTTDVCADCVALDDVWPALRMCLVCGYVGCCDTSKNTHMHRHYEETGHPIMRSIRMEEGWMWCYECDAFFEKRTLERYR
jgi:predicted ester cyclase